MTQDPLDAAWGQSGTATVDPLDAAWQSTPQEIGQKYQRSLTARDAAQAGVDKTAPMSKFDIPEGPPPAPGHSVVDYAYQYVGRPIGNVAPTVLEGVQRAAHAVVSGTTGGGPTIYSQGADATPKFPDVPELAGDFPSRVSDTLATVAGAAATGGVAVPATVIGLESFGAQYHSLTAQGVPPLKALTHAAAAGSVDATLATLAFGRIRAPLARTLGEAVTDGFVFAGVSGAQQAAHDAIEENATDVDLRKLFSGAEGRKILDAAAVGGVAGLILGAAKAVAASRGVEIAQEAPTDVGPSEPTSPKIEDVLAGENAAANAPETPDGSTIQDHPTPSETIQTPSTVNDLIQRTQAKRAKAEGDLRSELEAQTTATFKPIAGDGARMISPDASKPGRYRITSFAEDGSPTGHIEFATLDEAVKSAAGDFKSILASDGEKVQPAEVEPVRGTAGSATPEVLEGGASAGGAPPVVAEKPKAGQTDAGASLENGPAQGKEPAAPVSEGAADLRSEPVGIKNAEVDKDLAAMGFEPAKHGEKITNESVAAKVAESAKEGDGARLVESLIARPRTIEVEEAALLLHERNRLRLERDAAEKSLIEATDEPAKVEARERVKKAQTDFAKLAEAATMAGTKQGQALQFRRVLMAEDYSLAALEQRARVANDGEPLTETQTSEVKALHERIAKAEAALSEFETTTAARNAELEAENALLRLKREVRARRATPGKVEAFLAPKAEAALKRLSSAMTARSGPALSAQNLSDAAIVGAHLLVKGTAEAKAWTEAMVGLVGEHIRPHLPTILEHARALADGAPLEARRLQASKAGLKRGIEAKRAKIEAQDFDPKKPRPIQTDPEWIALKAESEAAKRDFERARIKFEREHRSRAKKIEDAVAEVFNLPKSFLSSYDFSAVFRQGGFFTLGHPVRSLRQMRQMFGATFSERRANLIDTEIRHRPGHEFAEASKLQLTSLNDPLNPQEEAIRSRLSDKIPGIKATNRAYITYLNLQRAQMFDAMVRGIPGEPTIEQGRAIANAVNVGSGRGHMGRFDPGTGVLASVLWAPRLFVSRFQVILGQPLYHGDMTTRKLVAKEYARFLIGAGAVYTLGTLMGGDVETDPRSSDFAKVKFGKSRIDPLGGLQQATVILSRTASGATKDQNGKIQPLKFDDIARFMRNKLSPTVSIPLNLRLGENSVGEKVTPGSTLQDVFVPLTFHDIGKELEAQGLARTTALKLLEAFGMGVQTYGPSKRR